MTKNAPVKAYKPTTVTRPVHAGTSKTPWPEGLTPFPFQITSVDFVLSRPKHRPHSYLALDPGLGKTVVARIVCNRLARSKIWRVYYVCPPFLTANVKAEFEKWGTAEIQLRVVPDTELASDEKIVELLWDVLLTEGPAILFVDEAHRFKNEKSKRTKGLFFLAAPFRRVVFMSGTPLPNSRPLELWPVLLRFAPDAFGTHFFSFAKRFCGAHRTHFGWKFDGFTNKAEFKRGITKRFMLRLRKDDVLDLPPKIESLLTVGDDMPAVVSNVERKILERYSPEDLVEGRLALQEGKDALHISEYLKLLGEYKLKYALPFIDSLLEETAEVIIIFVRHIGVMDRLKTHYFSRNPSVIDGRVPKGVRQGIVDRFQTDPKSRLFIGNIEACGIGFTITRATRVIFLEFSWRDGDNVQAADRAHRIGQNNSVLVQYVVLKNSIDGKRMQVLLTKRRNAV